MSEAVLLGATPSQTVGPYLHIGLTDPIGLNITELAPAGVAGERIVLQGQLIDADGLPVPDGMIEIWQANSHGKYAHPDDVRNLPLDAGFAGFGRTPTDAEGRFRFATIKPGPVPDRQGRLQAPHIMVNIFARGLIKQLVSRVYFEGDELAADPVLQQVPAERRSTLIASKVAAEPASFSWRIVLNGSVGETVFFDL